MSVSTSANQTRTRHVKVAEAFHLRRSSSDCPSTGLARRLGMRLDEVAKASQHEGVVCCAARRQLRSISCVSYDPKLATAGLYVPGNDRLRSHWMMMGKVVSRVQHGCSSRRCSHSRRSDSIC
jgi:hypothetical protein